MNKNLLKLIPVIGSIVLVGCSQTPTDNKGKKGYVDPFLIGDNLEAINLDEAKLIATEAYNNLNHISKLTKSITTVEDTTTFYVGGLSTLGNKVNKKETWEVDYYKNVLDRKYSLSNAVENEIVGKSLEERSNEMIEWYDYKKGSETEFSMYSKTTTTSNRVTWDTYAITNLDFADTNSLTMNWNRYLIKNSAEFSDISIYFDANLKYVRDGMHILGYQISTIYESDRSPIAPGKLDVSITKKTSNISVVAFLENDNIGWTVESVAVKNVVSYLNNLSGNSIDELVVETNESVASYVYTSEHEKHSVPKYKEDTSSENPLYISSFDETGEYVSTVATFSNNDDYYRQIEAGYDGRAFYIERYLTEGIYSIYDKDHTLSFSDATYEVWGYKDIIDNRCPSFIKDVDLEEHDGLFYVSKAGVYSFEIVFDKEMEEITTFSVAKMG